MRTPPSNPEAEKALLGSIVYGGSSLYASACETVSADDFFDPLNRSIFEAFAALATRADPIDLVTTTSEMRRAGRSATVALYLSELSSSLGSDQHVTTYARMIREAAMKRRMIESLTLLVGKAYDPASDAFDLADEAARDIESATGVAARTFYDVAEQAALMMPAYDALEASGVSGGISWGFDRLDEATGGQQPGDQWVTAAASSIGKTSMAVCQARRGVRLYDHPEAYFSTEETATQITQRIVCGEARVSVLGLRTGTLTVEEKDRLRTHADSWSKIERRLLIQHDGQLTPEGLYAKSRNLVRYKGVKRITVDNLQNLIGSDPRMGKQQVISLASRLMKALCLETGCTTNLLTQITGDERESRPSEDNLRWAKEIYNDADVVNGLYRAEHYGVSEDETLGRSTEGLGEIIPLKVRFGAKVDTIYCTYIKESMIWVPGLPANTF